MRTNKHIGTLTLWFKTKSANMYCQK